jgi:hypothetical protein
VSSDVGVRIPPLAPLADASRLNARAASCVSSVIRERATSHEDGVMLLGECLLVITGPAPPGVGASPRDATP